MYGLRMQELFKNTTEMLRIQNKEQENEKGINNS